MAAPVTAPAAVASTAESVPPAQQPATPAAAPRISGEWRSSLGAWIGANQVYPEDARRSGAQGNVAVRLTVDHLGHVLTVELVHSAGSALLDETSLAMLKGATLPPFPAEMTQDRLTITVQVHYSLAN